MSEEIGLSEIKILLLDDDEDDFIIIEYMLEELVDEFNPVIDWQSEFAKAEKLVENGDYDICLVDYRLGERNGLEFLEMIRDKQLKIPIILLTGQGDSAIDFEAMKLGASDYLIKGEFDSRLLGRSIRYALQSRSALNELNAEEEKYRSLFERSVDPIYITNKEHLFIDVNPAFLELFEYKKDRLLSLSLKSIFKSKKTYSYFNQELAKILQVKGFEAKLCTESRKEVDCIINCVALKNENGKIYGYQGVIHDRTDKKRAERELLVAEKLATTGQMARSIAHEVRNPLTNLHLALEQLKDEIEDESVDLYLDIIQRNAERIGQLVTDMMSSSKPKPLNKQQISINKLLDETLQKTQDRFQLRGIKLQKDFETEIANFQGDEEQLKTAFLNIIINAIEAMEENKGKLQVATYVEDSHIVTEIKDNGRGISEEKINRLFDPFFTAKKGGMGLGLTSTKNILNNHDARLEVESEEGKGTTFYVYFNSN